MTCRSCGHVHSAGLPCNEAAVRRAPATGIGISRVSVGASVLAKWMSEATWRAWMAPTPTDRVAALRLIPTDGLTAADLVHVEAAIAAAGGAR